MVSGWGLSAWSIVDKQRWQSLEFLGKMLSVMTLFHFVFLSHSPFLLLLTYLLTFICARALWYRMRTLSVTGAPLWVRANTHTPVWEDDWCWCSSGDQYVRVLGEAPEVLGWHKASCVGQPCWCQSTGQRAPPAAPMISLVLTAVWWEGLCTHTSLLHSLHG